MGVQSIGKWIFREFNRSLFNTKAKDYFEPIVSQLFAGTSLVETKAKLIEKRVEQEDVCTFVLKPNKNWKGFIAGQFIEIVVEVDGVLLPRIFSVSSSPEYYIKTGLLELTIKKQENGKVTTALFEQNNEGDFFVISNAMGEFTLLNSGSKKILFIAGGSGITPFRSILNSGQIIGREIEVLFYANKANHLFRNELENLSATHDGLNINFIDGVQSGRICMDHLLEYCADFNERHIYMCGPPGMMTTVKTVLQNTSFDFKNLMEEVFHPRVVVNDGFVAEKGRVTLLNGQERVFLSDGKETLLDFIESKNILVKSGCRMGICKQCQCKKTQGVVYNIRDNEFSENNSEMIQICVSIPIGDVTIEIEK